MQIKKNPKEFSLRLLPSVFSIQEICLYMFRRSQYSIDSWINTKNYAGSGRFLHIIQGMPFQLHQKKWDLHILMINHDAKFRHILPMRRTAGLEFWRNFRIASGIMGEYIRRKGSFPSEWRGVAGAGESYSLIKFSPAVLNSCRASPSTWKGS